MLRRALWIALCSLLFAVPASAQDPVPAMSSNVELVIAESSLFRFVTADTSHTWSLPLLPPPHR